MKLITAIINPIAGKGHALRLWEALLPELKKIAERVEYRLSSQVEDVGMLVRLLLSDAPDYLLVIGGDGTLSQAVNAMIVGDQLLSKDTCLAYYNSGSAGDYIRQFPKQTLPEFLQRLKYHQTVKTNIGKIYKANNQIHYFINIASCGISATIADNTKHSNWLKKLGGGANYFFHALIGLIKYQYKIQNARIHIDNELYMSKVNLMLLAVCNGQYFGGKMHVAPMAKPDDGLLDVVIFHDFTLLSALTRLVKIYFGSHINDERVRYIQAKSVEVEMLDKSSLLIEADGEPAGQLPARFEIWDELIDILI